MWSSELLKAAADSMMMDKFTAFRHDYWVEDFEYDPDDPAPEYVQEAEYWAAHPRTVKVTEYGDGVTFKEQYLNEPAPTEWEVLREIETKRQEKAESHIIDALTYGVSAWYPEDTE